MDALECRHRLLNLRDPLTGQAIPHVIGKRRGCRSGVLAVIANTR